MSKTAQNPLGLTAVRRTVPVAPAASISCTLATWTYFIHTSLLRLASTAGSLQLLQPCSTSTVATARQVTLSARFITDSLRWADVLDPWPTPEPTPPCRAIGQRADERRSG